MELNFNLKLQTNHPIKCVSRIKIFSVTQVLKNLAPMGSVSQEATAGCALPKWGGHQGRRCEIQETRNPGQRRKESPWKCVESSQDISCAMDSNNCVSGQPVRLQPEDSLWRKTAKKMELETIARFTHKPEYLGMT